MVSAGTRAEDANTPDADKARIEIYGQVMLDSIYDFKRMDPDWNATLRPSKIPVVCPGSAGCGKDGAWIFSARQSSLGLRSFIPTSWGLVKTDLSFDLFGTDGSTSIHWLSIWAEMGMFGVGQTYSNFMDIDVFPNTIDYWGPSGMVFVRNPQLRITPWSQGRHGHRVHARSAELGPRHRQDQRDLTGLRRRLHRLEPAARPDRLVPLSTRDWGHVKAGRHPAPGGLPEHADARWQPVGHKTGYGLNLTGALKVFGKDQLNAGFVWGKAIASYMNDGGVDLAPGHGGAAVPRRCNRSAGWPTTTMSGPTNWSSTIGFSQHMQDNTAGQTATAFRRGSYGNVNLLYTPWKNVLTGLEFVWGELEQKDGQSATDYRLQFSTKVTF